MDTVRVAYRDDDRTPVIYCIKEMGAKHYGINVEALRIKDYSEFEASLFNNAADVLIDHVEFLYAEAGKGRGKEVEGQRGRAKGSSPLLAFTKSASIRGT